MHLNGVFGAAKQNAKNVLLKHCCVNAKKNQAHYLTFKKFIRYTPFSVMMESLLTMLFVSQCLKNLFHSVIMRVQVMLGLVQTVGPSLCTEVQELYYKDQRWLKKLPLYTTDKKTSQTYQIGQIVFNYFSFWFSWPLK